MTREEAKDIIKRMYKGNPTPIQLKALEIAYAALQEPERKHGYWIYQGEADENYDINCTCSVCGAGDTHATDATVPYCWWCGAIMDGKEPIKDEQENQEKA